MADYLKIRLALEQGFEAFNAANLVAGAQMPIAYENQRYDRVVGVAYQELHLLPATSSQPGNGPNGRMYDTGVFQVSLYYPRDEGPGAAAGRADLLRTYFKRGGTPLSFGGVTVSVERTPSISPARIQDDWYVLVVSIPYFIYS